MSGSRCRRVRGREASSVPQVLALPRRSVSHSFGSSYTLYIPGLHRLASSPLIMRGAEELDFLLSNSLGSATILSRQKAV